MGWSWLAGWLRYADSGILVRQKDVCTDTDTTAAANFPRVVTPPRNQNRNSSFVVGRSQLYRTVLYRTIFQYFVLGRKSTNPTQPNPIRRLGETPRLF